MKPTAKNSADVVITINKALCLSALKTQLDYKAVDRSLDGTEQRLISWHLAQGGEWLAAVLDKTEFETWKRDIASFKQQYSQYNINCILENCAVSKEDAIAIQTAHIFIHKSGNSDSTVQIIDRITACIASIPSRMNSNQLTMSRRVPKMAAYENAFAKMLKQIPGIADGRAEAVVKKYPTVMSFFQAMNGRDK
ncbi:hypothetical protein BC936DRAFT_145216 [Jimgerdemannia flammicorona]|uniref:ERCC4 domain-containing protein n=1 Tax=Jimgerdemannia flammicorona TaxID=994334 RepID=A0A433DAI2_9FUNG|nr:hypothetical protein BC936DRAFT_145216 [Jimgerdemannia flammicorona]